jgi:hypothetical protein
VGVKVCLGGDQLDVCTAWGEGETDHARRFRRVEEVHFRVRVAAQRPVRRQMKRRIFAMF